MPIKEPKKPPMPGGRNQVEPTPGLRQESGTVAALELEGDWMATPEGVEDTVAGQKLESRLVLVQKPEHDLVPTSTALQVYVPHMPVVQTQGSVAVVRPQQEQLHQAQQTLLKLMADYTAIVLYLL